ncbi:hypothetical protein LU293_07790 [Moraxella nasovis]|uniref:hypothetical protein n=1 Tax=Moraxella nasovis TaxID=2904121 RepID=UPI001F61AD99|nr:hypothetical protein [Moraxella nasovis]UNU72978.1 hypothetical protein LU293_07790 [Moraxella nasovis]
MALHRKTAFNRSPYFDNYLNLCLTDIDYIPDDSQIITSDDVFDYMLEVRHLNQGIENHRQNLINDYKEYSNIKVRSLADFKALDTDKYKAIKKE